MGSKDILDDFIKKVEEVFNKHPQGSEYRKLEMYNFYYDMLGKLRRLSRLEVLLDVIKEHAKLENTNYDEEIEKKCLSQKIIPIFKAPHLWFYYLTGKDGNVIPLSQEIYDKLEELFE